MEVAYSVNGVPIQLTYEDGTISSRTTMNWQAISMRYLILWEARAYCSWKQRIPKSCEKHRKEEVAGSSLQRVVEA